MNKYCLRRTLEWLRWRLNNRAHAQGKALGHVDTGSCRVKGRACLVRPVRKTVQKCNHRAVLSELRRLMQAVPPVDASLGWVALCVEQQPAGLASGIGAAGGVQGQLVACIVTDCCICVGLEQSGHLLCGAIARRFPKHRSTVARSQGLLK